MIKAYAIVLKTSFKELYIFYFNCVITYKPPMKFNMLLKYSNIWKNHFPFEYPIGKFAVDKLFLLAREKIFSRIYALVSKREDD